MFAPVAPAIWSYGISGKRVVESWLSYRMRERAGRTPSALDSIHPERWTTDLTDELLTLLWIIERTIFRGRDQEELLDRILAGTLLEAVEVANPSEEARRAPVVFGGQARLAGLEEPGDQTQLDD